MGALELKKKGKKKKLILGNMSEEEAERNWKKTRSGTDEFNRNNMKVEKMDQDDNRIKISWLVYCLC